MAITYAAEVANTLDSSVSPIEMADGRKQGGRVRVWEATIEYDGQAASDEIILAQIPAGHKFLFGVITASATAGGTATIAIGEATLNDGSPDPDLLRAAATFTAADTPTTFGRSIAVEAGFSTEDKIISAVVGAAALPTSADSLVVQLFYASA